MSNSTATTGGGRAFTLADVDRAVKAISALPKATLWTLSAPNGDVWIGGPEELLAVLAPHHRLLKPMTIGEIFNHDQA